MSEQKSETTEDMLHAAMRLNPEQIEALCRRVMDENPRQVQAYHAGKSALGFLVGQVMKATNGTSNPQEVHTTFCRLMDPQ